MAFKAVDFVRKVRDRHFRMLKGKSFEEIRDFYSSQAQEVQKKSPGKIDKSGKIAKSQPAAKQKRASGKNGKK
ncbi:MAG: hypothetical protein PHQ23_03410 [Candidatus Wallbacteria bacterium]|nr:hypothetical protein [Candidatus Wallbacteria bacterium]